MSRKTAIVTRNDQDQSGRAFLASDETLRVELEDTWYGKIILHLQPEGKYEIVICDDYGDVVQTISGAMISEYSRRQKRKTNDLS